ncbi:MAG: peptide deformylase [Promicromonosporaceae bacterium]|nr:peptide deformylase [Promicromonosporaceae bacterium]
MPQIKLRRKPRTFWQGERASEYPPLAPESERGTARRVTEIGEPVLHTPAAPVGAEEFGTPELLSLIDDMFASMDVAEGVGLAAPQIGVGKQVFVFDLVDDDDDRHVGVICNPTLTQDFDSEPILRDEGCLSVPGAYEPLSRPSVARVSGFTPAGEPLELSAVGYLARCFIHETQHLQGTLYWDHLSPEAQEDALRQRDENRAATLARRAEVAIELAKPAVTYPEAPAGGR